ncbi:MAG: VCBS repeat-containing protein [Anaerolineales bacterium]|nr:VCBS repeat-containing protein [Anaerolineales bacterium]
MKLTLRRNPLLIIAVLLGGLVLAAAIPSLVAARSLPIYEKHTLADNIPNVNDLAAADIDGDGNLDVLGASLAADTVVWWQSDGTPGDGGWLTHTLTSTLNGASNPLAADINRDGKVDIFANGYFGEYVWWENDGTSAVENWSTHIITDVNQDLSSACLEDLDGDGDLDVAGALFNDNLYDVLDLIWLENITGEGTNWSQHAITTTFLMAFALFTADVDGDGDADMISDSSAPGLIWWENSAVDGSVWSAHTILSHSFSHATSLGDVDGDGDVDILGNDHRDQEQALWWENSDGAGGTWIEHTIDSSHDYTWVVRAADLDQDGDLDALGYTPYGDDLVWWENTAGDGAAWAEHIVEENLDEPSAVFAVDLDLDGDLDLLGSEDGTTEQVCWWENTAIHRNAAYTASEVIDAALPVWDVSTADVDGDGDLDLLGAATDHTTPTNGWLSWWRNVDGAGSAWTEVPVLVDGLDGAVAVRAGDLDDDGDMDLLAAGWQEDDVAWFENDDGLGDSWTRHDLITTYDGAYTVAIADVDGDGDLDALAGGSENATISWWENNRTDTGWAEHVVHYEHAHIIRKIEVADVDRDGDVDVIGVSNGKGYVAWWENDAAGTFWTRHYISGGLDAFPSPQSAHIGDMDRDGDVDVIVSRNAEGQAPVDLVWFENDASDTWTMHTIADQFFSADGVFATDLDQDGDLDVVAVLPSETQMALRWLENTAGDGSTWVARDLALPFYGRNLTAADIDGDGAIDILGANHDLDQLLLWRNLGGQFALATADTTPAGGFLPGQMEDMLSIQVTHNGRTGDHDAELATIELLFESSPGNPLTTAEANALIDELSVYLDTGSGNFDPAVDTLVTTLEQLDLTLGVQSLTLPDGAESVRVVHGAPSLFFIAPRLTADANQQTPSQFRITHLTEASTSAEDCEVDVPLQLEYAANTTSGTITLINHAPNALDDTPATDEDTPLVIQVTLNDTDEDNNPLAVISVTQPLSGSAVISGTQQVLYTPELNYNGADSFFYTISDGVLTDTATVNLTVLPVNDLPEVDAGADRFAQEGGVVIFSGAFTDPDSGQSHTIEWDFGDGGTASGELSPSHTYLDDGVYPVSLTVDDQEGGIVSDTLQITVSNVAPALSLGGAASLNEGAVYTLTLSTVTDPGNDTLTTCTVHWGDGATASCLPAIGGSLGHIYADGPADRTIWVDLEDEDGEYLDVDSLEVSLQNVAPVVDAGADRQIDMGGSLMIMASFIDPGEDTHTATIDWGDGVVEPGLVDQLAGTVSGSHQYSQPGNYTVTITLEDSDSAQNSDTCGVTVNPLRVFLPLVTRH